MTNSAIRNPQSAIKDSAIRNPQSPIPLLLVAGEASGDKHGAKLVSALRALRPEWSFEFFGAGGDEMRAVGVETLVDSREVAIMGALEVAKALPKFLRVFKRLRESANERKPALVVLIDWPEFNLRLAKKLHRDGHRVVYYISPQLWAWRSYRVNIVKRFIERMLVILPFEKEYYEGHGVEVDYVGHPLLDSVRVTKSKEAFCAEYGLDAGRPMVALLPGSRHTELKYILPPLLDAARLLETSAPEVQCILPLAGTFHREEVAGAPAGLRIVERDTYNAVAAADLAAVASGTATLETAILGTPLIVVYCASSLNWRIFHPMINVPYVGMPNLIAGREIAPELLQDALTGEQLSRTILAFLRNPARLAQARADMQEVKAKLGRAQASQRAAERIVGLIEK